MSVNVELQACGHFHVVDDVPQGGKETERAIVLRSQLIEAIALAVFYDGERARGKVWADMSDDQRRFYRATAINALDAAIGFLADNAEDWLTLIDPGLEWNAGSIAIRDVRDLIAALAGPEVPT